MPPRPRRSYSKKKPCSGPPASGASGAGAAGRSRAGTSQVVGSGRSSEVTGSVCSVAGSMVVSVPGWEERDKRWSPGC